MRNGEDKFYSSSCASPLLTSSFSSLPKPTTFSSDTATSFLDMSSQLSTPFVPLCTRGDPPVRTTPDLGFKLISSFGFQLTYMDSIETRIIDPDEDDGINNDEDGNTKQLLSSDLLLGDPPPQGAIVPILKEEEHTDSDLEGSIPVGEEAQAGLLERVLRFGFVDLRSDCARGAACAGASVDRGRRRWGWSFFYGSFSRRTIAGLPSQPQVWAIPAAAAPMFNVSASPISNFMTAGGGGGEMPVSESGGKVSTMAPSSSSRLRRLGTFLWRYMIRRSFNLWLTLQGTKLHLRKLEME
ncbi:hypothetical protein C3L33_03162, partial [Rhododendron williamsianum]